MRKLLVSLVLPLLMLFAQQGAVWHELGHLGKDAPSNQQQDKKLPAEKVCETCVAFTQLGGAAKAEVPALALLSFDASFAPWTATALASVEAPATRNRGPPTYL